MFYYYRGVFALRARKDVRETTSGEKKFVKGTDELCADIAGMFVSLLEDDYGVTRPYMAAELLWVATTTTFLVVLFTYCTFVAPEYLLFHNYAIGVGLFLFFIARIAWQVWYIGRCKKVLVQIAKYRTALPEDLSGKMRRDLLHGVCVFGFWTTFSVSCLKQRFSVGSFFMNIGVSVLEVSGYAVFLFVPEDIAELIEEKKKRQLEEDEEGE